MSVFSSDRFEIQPHVVWQCAAIQTSCLARSLSSSDSRRQHHNDCHQHPSIIVFFKFFLSLLPFPLFLSLPLVHTIHVFFANVATPPSKQASVFLLYDIRENLQCYYLSIFDLIVLSSALHNNIT